MQATTYVKRIAAALMGGVHLRPPTLQLRVASAAELPALLPFSHPISGYRRRTVEDRGIVVRYVVSSSVREMDRGGEGWGRSGGSPNCGWSPSCLLLAHNY